MFNNNLLRKNNIFKDIDDVTLNEIMKHFKKKIYNKDSCIIKKRDRVDDLFLVMNGKVEIIEDVENKVKNTVNLIDKYGMFGYNITLSANNVSRYDIIAIEDSVIASISKNEFLTLVKKYPVLNNNVIEFLANVNSYLIFQLDCLSKKSVKEKIIEVLKYYAYLHDSYEIVLPFNKNQLADFISVNRSSLSRELTKMQEEGIFRYENRYYYLNEEYF
jgi:CRP-like cAMP-binding protein